MSRFNSEAYDKLYPRQPEQAPMVETAAQGFNPTKNKLEGKQPDVQDPDPEPNTMPEEQEEVAGGNEDGNGKPGESDPE